MCNKDKNSIYPLPFPLLPMPSSYDPTVLLSIRKFSHFPPSYDPLTGTFRSESIPTNELGFPKFRFPLKRRQRTNFSSNQTLNLESEYQKNEYIPRPRRYELAETLNLTETQIKIWFQNRRAKEKRIEKAHLDPQYR